MFDQRGDPLPFGLTLFGNNALLLLLFRFGQPFRELLQTSWLIGGILPTLDGAPSLREILVPDQGENFLTLRLPLLFKS